MEFIEDEIFLRTFEKLIVLTADFKAESDRGCTLIAAAALDEQLELLLKSRLVEDQKLVKKSINYPGILSTFSARIDFAYLLGTIPKTVCDDLHQIREIRNDFAHVSNTRSFEDQSVKDRCANLKYGSSNVAASSKNCFITAAVQLMMFLSVQRKHVDRIEFRPESSSRTLKKTRKAMSDSIQAILDSDEPIRRFIQPPE